MPEAPPAPPAVSPAAQTPPAKPNSSLNDAFNDLDALGGKEPDQSTEKQADNEPETKPSEKAETPSQSDTPPETKLQQKKEADPAKPDEKKKDSEEFTPGNKEWRSSYEKVKHERDEYRTKFEELSKAKPAEDPEKPKLRETLAEKEKRLADVEDEMRFVAYERSTEYREKYKKPLDDAFSKAWKDVTELVFTEDNGTERPATKEDFNSLCRMSPQDARKWAKDHFTDDAQEVLSHRRKLIEINDQSTEALERFRKEGSEREKKQSEEQAFRAQSAAKAYESHSKAVLDKYKDPKWFVPEEGDEDGNKLLEQGLEIAKVAFGDGSKAPSEHAAMLQAEIGLRAAAFGKAVLKNQKLTEKYTAEIEALKARLKKYQESDPGAGDGGADEVGKNGNGPSVDDDLMAAAKGRL